MWKNLKIESVTEITECKDAKDIYKEFGYVSLIFFLLMFFSDFLDFYLFTGNFIWIIPALVCIYFSIKFYIKLRILTRQSDVNIFLKDETFEDSENIINKIKEG